MHAGVNAEEELFICLSCGKASRYTPTLGLDGCDKHYLYQKMLESGLVSATIKNYSEELTISDGFYSIMRFHFGVLCGDCAQREYDKWNKEIENLRAELSQINGEYDRRASELCLAEARRLLSKYMGPMSLNALRDMRVKPPNLPVDPVGKAEGLPPQKLASKRLLSNAEMYIRKNWDNVSEDAEYERFIRKMTRRLAKISSEGFFATPQTMWHPAHQYLETEFPYLTKSDPAVPPFRPKNPNSESSDAFHQDMYYWIIPIRFESEQKPGIWAGERDGVFTERLEDPVPNRIKFVRKPALLDYREKALHAMTADEDCLLERLLLEKFTKNADNGK